MKQVFANDGFRSLTANIATEKDKASGGTYVLSLISDQQFNAAYRTSWLAKRIVDLPAEDATRRWRSWSATKEQITALEKEEKRLHAVQNVRRAARGARLFGVSVIYISLSDVSEGGKLHKDPVDYETLGKDCVKRLSIIPRSRIRPGGEIDMNPDSEYFGGPAFYVMQTNGDPIEVHPSRLMIFYGDRHLSDDDTGLNYSVDGWHADSILQSLFTAIMSTDAATASVAAMLFEAKVDVYKVPNLMAMMEESPEYEKIVAERFKLANMVKSINNAIILDAEEDHEGKQLTFGGVSEAMEKFFQIAAGAAQIPVTKLFGRSPGGLNATGESDIRLYYDNCAGMQANDFDPSMQGYNRLLKISALGKDDEEVFHVWRPLWMPNDAEKSKMQSEVTNTGKALVDQGVKKEVAIEAVVNSLIEMEVMPGLEKAVEAAGGIKSIVSEDPPPLPTSTAPGVVLPPLASGAPRPNAANVVPMRRRAVGDAAPRTLYVHRKVLNADAIIQHYRDQGAEGLEDASELHVTIAYSTTPVDWMKMPPPYGAEIKLPAGGPRLHDDFNGGANVLLIRSYELEWRHEELKEAGATWGWDEYQPHITLAYGSSLEGVEPWQRTIVLGPELWEEVKQ